MGFIVPVFQIEKLRLREIKKLNRKTLLGEPNFNPLKYQSTQVEMSVSVYRNDLNVVFYPLLSCAPCS